MRLAEAAAHLVPRRAAGVGSPPAATGPAPPRPAPPERVTAVVAGTLTAAPPLRSIAPRFRPANPPLGRAGGGAAAVLPSPPGLSQPRVRRTPGRVGARANLLVGAIAGLLAVAGLFAFWLVEVHPRISQAALVGDIQTRDHPQAVRCLALKGNGSVWACGVAYHAESVCYLANVSVLGSWHTQVANHKCDRLPALAGIPPTATAAGVALDLQRQAGSTITACAKGAGYHNRWLCVERDSSGPTCVYVRVVPWVPFATNATAPNACRKNPHLRIAFLGG